MNAEEREALQQRIIQDLMRDMDARILQDFRIEHECLRRAREQDRLELNLAIERTRFGPWQAMPDGSWMRSRVLGPDRLGVQIVVPQPTEQLELRFVV